MKRKRERERERERERASTQKTQGWWNIKLKEIKVEEKREKRGDAFNGKYASNKISA